MFTFFTFSSTRKFHIGQRVVMTDFYTGRKLPGYIKSYGQHSIGYWVQPDNLLGVDFAWVEWLEPENA